VWRVHDGIHGNLCHRGEVRTAPGTHPGRARRAGVYAYVRAAVTSEPPSNGAAARDVYSAVTSIIILAEPPWRDARRGCRPGRLAFGLSHALRTLCRSVPLVVNKNGFFFFFTQYITYYYISHTNYFGRLSIVVSCFLLT